VETVPRGHGWAGTYWEAPRQPIGCFATRARNRRMRQVESEWSRSRWALGLLRGSKLNLPSCCQANRARVEGRADGSRHVSVVLVPCLLDPLGLGQMGGEAEVSMRRLLSGQVDYAGAKEAVSKESREGPDGSRDLSRDEASGHDREADMSKTDPTRGARPQVIPDRASGAPKTLPQDADGVPKPMAVTRGGIRPIEPPAQGSREGGPRSSEEET